MMFGAAINGVSDSMLLAQRRTAAAAAAKCSGFGGQNLDLALMIADGSAKGKADPAYEAHSGPIQQWAMAVWDQRLQSNELLVLAADAKVRLTKAKSPWSVCAGPAAAFIATAARIGWTITDAFGGTDDRGKSVDFVKDPPIVIKRRCEDSVRRWRWRRISQALPSANLGQIGDGACMEPIWRLLNGRGKGSSFRREYAGMLASAITGRQWSQERCFSAGLTADNKCRLCAQKIGNLTHRIWGCEATQQMRLLHAPGDFCSQVLAGRFCRATASIERALFPDIAATAPPPMMDETFHWHLEPPEGLLHGVVYSDGSRLDGPHDNLARLGWSFVAVDHEGKVFAKASGVPPAWIIDIPGAEAWAILQAAMIAMPGTLFKIDCRPCVDAIHRGRAFATAAQRPLARVFNLIFAAIDDMSPDAFIWMPAHTRPEDVGVKLLSDLSLLSHGDREHNDTADSLAKAAVEEHRAHADLRRKVKEQLKEVEDVARWVGMITYSANNWNSEPKRDTEASAARAAAARRAKNHATPRRLSVKTRSARPPGLGGHTLQHRGSRWRCSLCARTSATLFPFAPKQRPGSAGSALGGKVSGPGLQWAIRGAWACANAQW